MQSSTDSINKLIFMNFTKVFAAFSLQVCHKFKAPKKSRVGAGSGPSPPKHIYTHTHWNLSHRKWSCAASCQGRQIIHHLKNAPFSPLLYYSSSPSAPCLSSSLRLLFSLQVLQTGTVKETKSSATCVISKMSCIQTRNELLLWLHRPLNSGKYSPAVFPEDLWYSCPQYPHNTFVEFPKRMKSRFIWTLLKCETQIVLISTRLYYFTLQTKLWNDCGRGKQR